MVLIVLGLLININSYRDIFLIMEKSFLKGKDSSPPFPIQTGGKNNNLRCSSVFQSVRSNSML